MDKSKKKTGKVASGSVSASALSPATSSLGYPPMPPTPPSFQAAAANIKTPPAAGSSAPLPKRPRGRLFIGTVLVCFAAYCGIHFYEGYVRYAAYGEVVGRRIELAPPWEGVIAALHVREGDYVRQGDPVFLIESLEMRHRMEQLEDTLNLERARLASELARLKWDAERVEDTQQLIKAEYYEKWSELLWEQSVLTDIDQKLARAEKLHQQDAVADETLESLKHQAAGKQKRVSQLNEAVISLKRRLETDRPLESALNDQIKPALVRIENFQADLRRLRERLDRGLVTCPTNGRVTRIVKYSGEYVDGTAPVVELFVDGSTEIVLYMPQAKSQRWSIGDQLNVHIEPTRQQVACEVMRFAPGMQLAPESIMRHYDAGEVLLPVIVRPRDNRLTQSLILGSKVRLPRETTTPQIGDIANWFRGVPEPSLLSDPALHRARPKTRTTNSSTPGIPGTISLR